MENRQTKLVTAAELAAATGISVGEIETLTKMKLIPHLVYSTGPVYPLNEIMRTKLASIKPSPPAEPKVIVEPVQAPEEAAAPAPAKTPGQAARRSGQPKAAKE